MSTDPIVDEEPQAVTERDVMVGIRTQICDTQIEIEAIKTYGVKSQVKDVLPRLEGRLRSLMTQFHVYKALWK